MADNNKKKNPFSIYWIYGFIAVAIIGFQLFNNVESSVEVKSQQTFFSLAEKGYISHVFIVNKVRADFKLTKEPLFLSLVFLVLPFFHMLKFLQVILQQILWSFVWESQ